VIRRCVEHLLAMTERIEAKECDEMDIFNNQEGRAKPIGTESAEPAALE